MLNYYRRFIPKIADVLVPLHSAVASAGRSKDICWSKSCQEAFTTSKEALAKATLLRHPSPFAETALTVDASDFAIGAKLAQCPKGASGSWQPVAFFSKILSPAEKIFSAFDRELLAIYIIDIF